MSELSSQLREWGTGPMCHNPEHTDICNDLLRAADEIERLQAIVKEIWSELYGHGFDVLGWHRNGNTEPLDSWFEQNEWALKMGGP